MGLLSLFQRKTPGTGKADAQQPGDVVQRARSRARQRLIGAVVLVGIGIVGFPLLFETHPRPIPVDIPIEIANKDKAPPLVMPPARPNPASAAQAPGPAAPASAGIITESAGEAGREMAAPTPRAAPATANAAPSKADAASRTPAPSPGRDDAARAAPEARAAAKDESRAAADARFVVQVGAFAEASTAREARQRVEKLGLKTYTQDVDTAAGRRIRVRVGPFTSRDEADRVVGKLKSAGLPAALLTL